MANRFTFLREEIEEGLKDLEVRLQQLDVKWRLFFMGNKDQRYPPEKETEDLARDIRQFPTQHPLRASHQFKHANLAYRFNMMRERWNKWMRVLEERGRQAVMQAMGIHGPRVYGPAIQRTPPARPATETRRPVASPAGPYERVVREFEAAVVQTGKHARVDRRKLVAQLRQLESSLRKKVGDRPIEFYVTIEKGKPRIRARIRKTAHRK